MSVHFVLIFCFRWRGDNLFFPFENVHLLYSSGKSHSGTNQQNALLLKAIFGELQERRDDCGKMKEAIDRLEVCFLFFQSNLNSLPPLILDITFSVSFLRSERSKRFSGCVAGIGE